MSNFSVLSFILLSCWLQVQLTISETLNFCGQELPSNTKFEANQQIFNFYGSSCNQSSHDQSSCKQSPCDQSSCNQSSSTKPCSLPDGYQLSSEYGAYKIHADPKTWNDARKTCVAEGAHLGVFTSIKEIQFIQQALPKSNVPRVWVGYHDQFQEGDWTTVLDKPLGGNSGTVASWWPNQPDNYKGLQHCAVLNGNGMDDDTCGLKFPFVCKVNSKDCDFS